MLSQSFHLHSLKRCILSQHLAGVFSNQLSHQLDRK